MRKLTYFVTLIVITSLGLVACGKKTEVKYVEVEKARPLACAQQNDYSIEDNRVVQMEEIVFKRIKQRVIRYDCKGEVISDKIETNVYNKMDFDLYSKKRVKGKQRRVVHRLKNISGEAYNRQTCNTAKRDLLSIVPGIFFDGFKTIGENLTDKINEFNCSNNYNTGSF